MLERRKGKTKISHLIGVKSALVFLTSAVDLHQNGDRASVLAANQVLNDRRILLGVPHDTLENFGAVSAETAEAMAVGACRNLGTDASIAVTGIAGPGGGTPEKPVGLVYVGVCFKGKVNVIELR